MATDGVYWDDNDRLLRITLSNLETGDPLVGSTIRVTMTQDGVEVPGLAWPHPVPPDPLTPGRYETLFPHTLETTPGKIAKVHITADGQHGHVEFNGRYEVCERGLE